jgi:hypothetical protein
MSSESGAIRKLHPANKASDYATKEASLSDHATTNEVAHCSESFEYSELPDNFRVTA